MNIAKSFLTNRTVVLHHGGMIFSEEREIVSLTAVVYRPRNPQLSDYYRCVEDYFEIGFNPHCHILVTDGCFYGNKGTFHHNIKRMGGFDPGINILAQSARLHQP